MSTPFQNEEFEFAQPDGSVIRVRGTGSQYKARFETLDGYAVVQDPITKFYHYAVPDARGDGVSATEMAVGAGDPAVLGLTPELKVCKSGQARGTQSLGLPRGLTRWEERRAAHRQAERLASVSGGVLPAPPRRRTVGTYVGLTLLVDFPDRRGTIPRDEVEAFCNQAGYSGFGNRGSVRDYFYDISDGKLTFTNIVAPYYTAKHNRDYYTDPGIPYPSRAQELVHEALEHLFANGFDPAPLSVDEKGYIYAVSAFYAGRRSNAWSEGLWPHQYSLIPRELGPGRIARDYQITDMASTTGEELSLGTFCHELGHMLCDFPDLYDYDDDSNGAGKFCLMCAGGSWPREKNPVQVGAYLKHAAGWTSRATLLQPGQTVTLRAGLNDFALHRKSRSEYFIIENRAASGRDSDLDADGLAVWHIDELGNNRYEMGTPTHHYECALIQADGLRELEANGDEGDSDDLFKRGHNDRLDHQTNPNSNWWDQSRSGLVLSQISGAGPTMSFKAG